MRKFLIWEIISYNWFFWVLLSVMLILNFFKLVWYKFWVLKELKIIEIYWFFFSIIIKIVNSLSFCF